MRLKWKLVLIRLEIVLILTQDKGTICTKRTIGSKIILDVPNWYTLVTRLKWKLILVHLEILLILMQDRCIVYAECTKAWKTFWTHSMELLGDVALVESHSVHLETVLVSELGAQFAPNIP
jgi:hypothetical protein